MICVSFLRNSPDPSRSSVWRAEKVRKTGYSSVLSLVIHDDNVLAEHFIADPRVALMSFTGSNAVGKHVAEVAARRIGKCLLECSGNNAINNDVPQGLPSALFTTKL